MTVVLKSTGFRVHVLYQLVGHFTFWLRPWLSLLAEPKTTLSQR